MTHAATPRQNKPLDRIYDVFLSHRPNKGTGRLLRVALGEDGQLRPGTSTPLPEVAWGWPQELFLMKGRAVLVHMLATKEQSLGATVLHTIDVAAGRVLAARRCWGGGWCGATPTGARR